MNKLFLLIISILFCSCNMYMVIDDKTELLSRVKSSNFEYNKTEILIPRRFLKSLNNSLHWLEEYRFTTSEPINRTDVRHRELPNQLILDNGIDNERKLYCVLYKEDSGSGEKLKLLIVLLNSEKKLEWKRIVVPSNTTTVEQALNNI